MAPTASLVDGRVRLTGVALWCILIKEMEGRKKRGRGEGWMDGGVIGLEGGEAGSESKEDSGKDIVVVGG